MFRVAVFEFHGGVFVFRVINFVRRAAVFNFRVMEFEFHDIIFVFRVVEYEDGGAKREDCGGSRDGVIGVLANVGRKQANHDMLFRNARFD